MGDVSNLVTIRCDNHHDILFRGLWNMFLAKQKVDCDMQYTGRTIRVHRLLLDVFLSPDSQKLQSDPATNPVDPDSNCLDLMVEFMYSGRVTVRQDQLKELLKLARDCKFHMLVGAVQTVMKRLEDERFELKRAQKFRRFDPAFLKPTSKFQQGGAPELASDLDESSSSSGDELPEASDEMLVAFKSQLSSRLERLVTYSRSCQETQTDSRPNGTEILPDVKPVVETSQPESTPAENTVKDVFSGPPIKAEPEHVVLPEPDGTLAVIIKPEPADDIDSDEMEESAIDETILSDQPQDSDVIPDQEADLHPEPDDLVDLQVKKIKLDPEVLIPGDQQPAMPGDHGDCACVMCDPCRTNLGPWEPEPPQEPVQVPAEELDPRKLRRRFRIHMARHPFECGECHMHFNQRYQLLEHAGTHSDPATNK